MKKVFFLFSLFTSLCLTAWAGPATSGEAADGGDQGQAVQDSLTLLQQDAYFLDENQLEARMSAATHVSHVLPFATVERTLDAGDDDEDGDPDIAVALICCLLLGGIGLHRVILGGRPGLIFLYCITCCGCFGVVPTIDFFILLFELGKGQSRMRDNDDFIAW